MKYAIALIFLFSCRGKQSADLIVHHARIYTVDSAFSTAEAMAVKDGRILATGSDADILGRYTAPVVTDLGGKAVYPGFIDAHSHFVGYGESLFMASLLGSTSDSDMVARVKQFADAHPGMAWIRGRGWDQNKFPGAAFPDNTLLNQVFPSTPVVLGRVDGHALLANAKALELAGVRPGQKVDGGVIGTSNGRLTGIMIDNAMQLVYSRIPPLTPDGFLERAVAAEGRCFAQGLTTVADCGLDKAAILTLDSLQKAGKLRMRIYAMVSDSRDDLDYFIPKGPYKTDLLYVNAVKAYADGALGSRGACLLAPYSDRPGVYGYLLHPVAHYDSLAARLAPTAWQLCTHAIGDSGNRMILNVYARHLPGRNDRRWRVEHAQVISVDDFSLFGRFSIIPSVQPTHATSDMYWAGERLGPARLPSAYAYQRLLAQNGWLPLGTDFPVEDISPFKTFLAAVFRVDAKGFPPGGFQPSDALSRMQAIRGMTIWAARADFLENEIGSLEAGKRADFVVLDEDLMTVGAADVLGVKVGATYAAGVKVF